jgi:hypothetical protein
MSGYLNGGGGDMEKIDTKLYFGNNEMKSRLRRNSLNDNCAKDTKVGHNDSERFKIRKTESNNSISHRKGN